jgi:hypothetical protein
MSVSKTSISNLALSRFGGGKITSLDDGTEKARQLDINYDNCLETALRAFPWNFARKIELLALTDDTTPGWTYVYKYPANCANVLRVCDESSARYMDKKYHTEFKIISDGSEKYIACDLEDAYVEYTLIVTDPTLYDALFIKAFSYLLAAETCNSLSGNAQKAQEMMQKYALAIGEAQLAGANENYTPFTWPTSYVDGR